MKKLSLVLFLMALLITPFALAQGFGTIEGDVTNGSLGNEPVPGITVTLHIFDSKGVEKASLATLTDQEGRFVFKGVEIDRSLLYVAVVNFGGIIYRSPALSFMEGKENLYLPVIVYEATESDENILVNRAHFIFNVDPAAKLVSVMEMYSVVNNGQKTLVGSDGVSLRFSLPHQAQNFNSESLTMRGGEAIYLLPVLPGPMPQPFILEYSLPVQGDSLELRRSTYYPVQNYNIFVSDVGLSVEVPGTGKAGKISRGEKVFLNYMGENLPKNGEIMVKLAGFTKIGTGRMRDFKWATGIAVLAALTLLGFLLAYSFLRRR